MASRPKAKPKDGDGGEEEDLAQAKLRVGLYVMWLLLVGLVVRGNGQAKEDLVARLPGQPEVGFKQWARYVDVDVKAGMNLFYYFVESEKNSDHKPISLWLNGGWFFLA
ncbi:hypothetical protein RJ640_005320 [Escallonia rubra]|uniref:Uncharacterized protein n=1 Tax=Escallonia rubra TaxID=112253 RepID=A0AA88QBY4_9ASTE|nr:hypothetical protein RJ640_005320 [Escallonia rubra]